jgi:hypothetical protein
MLKGKGKLQSYTNNIRAPITLQRRRTSLRNISIILKKQGLSHGIASIKDNGNNNNKAHNETATQAFELYDKGNGPVQVAIRLSL